MTPHQLVAEIKGLYSLPEVCLKINGLVNSPRASAEDIASLIAQDADLSARLLRTVNSAVYGLRMPVDTIRRAVTIIGTRDLVNLAIMTSACDVFRGIPSDLINMDDFWRKSVACGVLGQEFGKKASVLHPERMVVMGVLHEIGLLVFIQQLPDLSRVMLERSRDESRSLLSLQKEMVGFTHTDIAGLLLKSWNLPENICYVISHYDQPIGDRNFLTETSIIHVSSHIAAGMHSGGDLDKVLERVDQRALDFLKLNADDCMQAFNFIADEVREMYANLVGQKSSGRV